MSRKQETKITYEEVYRKTSLFIRIGASIFIALFIWIRITRKFIDIMPSYLRYLIYEGSDASFAIALLISMFVTFAYFEPNISARTAKNIYKLYQELKKR